MQGNLSRRVDVVFPIEGPALKDGIVDEILAAMQAGNQKPWVLRPDGQCERINAGTHARTTAPLQSQEHFVALGRRVTLADASRSLSVEALLTTGTGARRRKRV